MTYEEADLRYVTRLSWEINQMATRCVLSVALGLAIGSSIKIGCGSDSVEERLSECERRTETP